MRPTRQRAAYRPDPAGGCWSVSPGERAEPDGDGEADDRADRRSAHVEGMMLRGITTRWATLPMRGRIMPRRCNSTARRRRMACATTSWTFSSFVPIWMLARVSAGAAELDLDDRGADRRRQEAARELVPVSARAPHGLKQAPEAPIWIGKWLAAYGSKANWHDAIAFNGFKDEDETKLSVAERKDRDTRSRRPVPADAATKSLAGQKNIWNSARRATNLGLKDEAKAVIEEGRAIGRDPAQGCWSARLLGPAPKGPAPQGQGCSGGGTDRSGGTQGGQWRDGGSGRQYEHRQGRLCQGSRDVRPGAAEDREGRRRRPPRIAGSRWPCRATRNAPGPISTRRLPRRPTATRRSCGRSGWTTRPPHNGRHGKSGGMRGGATAPLAVVPRPGCRAAPWRCGWSATSSRSPHCGRSVRMRGQDFLKLFRSASRRSSG